MSLNAVIPLMKSPTAIQPKTFVTKLICAVLISSEMNIFSMLIWQRFIDKTKFFLKYWLSKTFKKIYNTEPTK
jgi:hypothetical protein